jgi:hypothetical protein
VSWRKLFDKRWQKSAKPEGQPGHLAMTFQLMLRLDNPPRHQMLDLLSCANAPPLNRVAENMCQCFPSFQKTSPHCRLALRVFSKFGTEIFSHFTKPFLVSLVPIFCIFVCGTVDVVSYSYTWWYDLLPMALCVWEHMTHGRRRALSSLLCLPVSDF